MLSPSMDEHHKKCPFCLAEIQKEAKKCSHCGEWVVEERFQSTKQDKKHSPPILEQEHEPLFPKCLAWYAVAINATYLIFTMYRLWQDFPEKIEQHIIVGSVVIVFILLYYNAAKNLIFGIFKISAVISWIGLIAAIVAFWMDSDVIMAGVTAGAGIWVVLNILALKQVRRYRDICNAKIINKSYSDNSMILEKQFSMQQNIPNTKSELIKKQIIMSIIASFPIAIVTFLVMTLFNVVVWVNVLTAIAIAIILCVLVYGSKRKALDI